MNVILLPAAQLQSPQQGVCFLALFMASGVKSERRIKEVCGRLLFCVFFLGDGGLIIVV
jgi:hypothetical protein